MADMFLNIAAFVALIPALFLLARWTIRFIKHYDPSGDDWDPCTYIALILGGLTLGAGFGLVYFGAKIIGVELF